MPFSASSQRAFSYSFTVSGAVTSQLVEWTVPMGVYAIIIDACGGGGSGGQGGFGVGSSGGGGGSAGVCIAGAKYSVQPGDLISISVAGPSNVGGLTHIVPIDNESGGLLLLSGNQGNSPPGLGTGGAGGNFGFLTRSLSGGAGGVGAAGAQGQIYTSMHRYGDIASCSGSGGGSAGFNGGSNPAIGAYLSPSVGGSGGTGDVNGGGGGQGGSNIFASGGNGGSSGAVGSDGVLGCGGGGGGGGGANLAGGIGGGGFVRIWY